MDVLEFLLRSLSLPEISKAVGVFISSKEGAIADVEESTGVSLSEARQMLLAACSKVAIPVAVLDGHAHMGKICAPKDMRTWKEDNLHGSSLILGNLDFHGEGARQAPQGGTNMVFCIGIHPRFAESIYNMDLAGFAQCVRNGGWAGIGETGLCSRWVFDKTNPVRLNMQLRLFRFHLLLCKVSGLPLILHIRSSKGFDCLGRASNMMEKEDLPKDHPIMLHCFNGSLEEANDWRNKWTGTLFSFNVHFCKPEILLVASKLPLSTLSVESDCPHLGRDPTSTNALIDKIAAVREEPVPVLKGAILGNMLRFLQPAVGSGIWPEVFEVAASYSRKPTDMSVVHRHVQHFTTNTEPQLKWSESDQREGEGYDDTRLGKSSTLLNSILGGTPKDSKKANLRISNPKEFRQVSAIIDVDLVPETCRRVKLLKHGSDKPLGFYIRDGTSVRVTPQGLEKVPGIFISRLVPGGLAESTGLLAVYDEVLEVNGIEVAGKSLDQVTDIMMSTRQIV